MHHHRSQDAELHHTTSTFSGHAPIAPELGPVTGSWRRLRSAIASSDAAMDMAPNSSGTRLVTLTPVPEIAPIRSSEMPTMPIAPPTSIQVRGPELGDDEDEWLTPDQFPTRVPTGCTVIPEASGAFAIADKRTPPSETEHDGEAAEAIARAR